MRLHLGFGFSPKPLIFCSVPHFTFRKQRKLPFQVSRPRQQSCCLSQLSMRTPETSNPPSIQGWRPKHSWASASAWECLSQLSPSFSSQAEMPISDRPEMFVSPFSYYSSISVTVHFLLAISGDLNTDTGAISLLCHQGPMGQRNGLFWEMWSIFFFTHFLRSMQRR